MTNPAWKMYVFRDGKYEIAGAELISRLRGALCRACHTPEKDCEDCLLAALIAAGELECALLDSASDDAHPDETSEKASGITDELACAFLTGRKDSLLSILHRVEQLRVQRCYRAAVQEGFAYYALHPRKLAGLIDTLLGVQGDTALGGRAVRVLGIRSIGLTLSAVACAALALRGIDCRRIGVRPEGHPYDRKLEASSRLRQWVSEADAEFLIVDEGPGISGSSFLAVAEAVEGCGIPRSRIRMIGSRQVNPATLLAPDAADRWARYDFYSVPAEPLPPDEAGESLSPGAWQRYFNGGEESAAGLWTPLEPAMYLARDRQSTYCFAGFGHYGEAVCARAKVVADAGFAPSYLGSQRGFRQSALIPGQTLAPGDLSAELLARMARYLALRSEAFAAAAQTPELETMLRWNWQLEFGEELGIAESHLQTQRVAVCDGRMGPNQWLRSGRGELLKLDAGNDGDNHFFPGPCDIAWDVAGCIVEWELRGRDRECLVAEYTRLSGDSVAERLGPYLLAYTTFCMARSRMAAAAMQGEAGEALLQRAYARYRLQNLRLRPLPPLQESGLRENGQRESAGAELGESLLQPGLGRG
jgi:hypothetical protein